MDAGLLVLSESAHELVVWKPAGLASERRFASSSRAGGAEDSALSLVARRLPSTTPRLPHRLDRVTRGILLVCLSPEATRFHGAQIEARRWEKYYLARVAAPARGGTADLLGTHKAFLGEEKGRARIVKAGGKPAWLEILGAAAVPGRPDRWHLLIRLLTGRFHQIRVMCEALGVPLAGDPLYDPARRDPTEHYLEHLVLKYTPLGASEDKTIFLPEHPERGPLAPSLASLVAQIVARPSDHIPEARFDD